MRLLYSLPINPRFACALSAAGLLALSFFPLSAAAQAPGAPASAIPAARPAAIPSADDSAPAPGTALVGAALAKALQVGGLVIYFRHTATDFSQTDSASTGYSDCANQRLLAAQGRLDAEAIGKEIRRLKLPVAEVLASPMCRTMDHAERSFGKAAVSPRAALREAQAGLAASGATGGAGGLSVGGGDYAELKTWMATAPSATGTGASVNRTSAAGNSAGAVGNRFIVGHGIPFRAVAGAPHLAEGEAAVLRPEGKGWRVLARLQVADWAKLEP